MFRRHSHKNILVGKRRTSTIQTAPKFEVFEVPTDHPGNAAEGVDDYTVTEASGGAYIGSHNGATNDGDDWVKYEFTVEADDWHFWGRGDCSVSRRQLCLLGI